MRVGIFHGLLEAEVGVIDGMPMGVWTIYIGFIHADFIFYFIKCFYPICEELHGTSGLSCFSLLR